MTNEVESAAVSCGSIGELWQEQVAVGNKYIEMINTWFMQNWIGLVVNIVLSIVLLLVGWLLISLITKAVRIALIKSGKDRALLSKFVISVLSKSLWALLAVMVLSRLGINVTPLIAGLGVTGFILGFACQESLGNLASGLMIAINEPFKIGDFIAAAGFEGTVSGMNMMATVLSTVDNKRIVLPNKSVWGAPIVNYTANETRRIDMQVGISYESDIRRAIETIDAILAEDAAILKEPAPLIAVASLDESAVTLNIRPWVKTGDYWDVKSRVLKETKERLSAAGVEIPFPQIVVHSAK